MKQSRETQSLRQSNFKKGIDTEDARRRRDDSQYSIRKTKREEKLMKKRYSHTIQKETPRVKTTVKDQEEFENELYDLLYNEDNDSDIIENAQKLNSSEFESVIEAAIFFRTASSRDNPPFDKIIKANIIPTLVRLSTSINYPDLQYETLWALSNIASGESKYTEKVATSSNIVIFIKLLECKEVKVRDHAMLVLGNIAGDSSEFRKMIMNAPIDTIQIIIKNIQYAPNATYAQNALWLLANLSREKPHFSFEEIPQRIIPMLGVLLNYQRDQLSSDLLAEIFWLVFYLTNRNDSQKIIKLCIKNGIISKVIELTYFSKSATVELPAIKILGNVAFLGETETQYLIDNKIFFLLPHLLRSNNRIIRKETFYTLSNIAAGTESQQADLVNFNNNQLISETIFTVNDDKDWNVKKEAAYVIYNLITNKKQKYKNLFLKKLIITPVVNLLDAMSIDTITVSLKIIKELLKEENAVYNVAHMVDNAGGLDKIEILQTHDNDNIYQLSVSIIDEYFSGDDDILSLAPPLLDQWESHHTKTQFDF